MMARLAYTLGLALLLPYALFHLLWRSRRQPGYRRHVGERFGIFPAAGGGAPLIWIHAVSVGETRAAQPLVAALRARYPGHRILLTHATPTGREASAQVFGDTVERAYLPYDFPFAVRRFLAHYRPAAGLVMETEIWPNLVAACRHARLPLLLVNARLSEKSARRYARFARLTRGALEGLAAVAAQAEDDAARLRALGARDVTVTGNLKYDLLPPPAQLELGRALRARFGTRPVLLAASTREGEEGLLLRALARKPLGAALLVLVPRHPQRFGEVAELARQGGFAVQRRSEDRPVEAQTTVLVGDSMGEMFAYYAACDLAFIGGSLLDYGSQNLIEACAVGKPVLIGPSTFNFAQAADEALACGAARQVASAEALLDAATELLADENRRVRMGAAGRAFAARHRGATARTLARVEPYLPPVSG